MHVPVMLFRMMTCEENIEVVQDLYAAEGGELDMRRYIQQYFPELPCAEKVLSQAQIAKVVSKRYEEAFVDIQQDVQRYTALWMPRYEEYMSVLTRYLHTTCPPAWSTIEAAVGLLPVYPRYLEARRFSIDVGFQPEQLVEACAHEILHFVWFQKWQELFPDYRKAEFEAPHRVWMYSEMVTDPILNSRDLQAVLHVRERSYDSFYTWYDEAAQMPVMQKLALLFAAPLPIEERICKGYTYMCEWLEQRHSVF